MSVEPTTQVEVEAGEASAGFDAFYAATSRDLWAYALAAGGYDRGRADDVTQESFLRLLRSTTRFENDEHRRRYLFRIAANLLEDARRRARRRPEEAFPVGADATPREEREVAAAVRPLSPSASDLHARTDVERALRALAPRERSLLWLAHVEEWSHGEIAERLGVRSGSVRVMLFRARRRLAAILGNEPEQDGAEERSPMEVKA